MSTTGPAIIRTVQSVSKVRILPDNTQATFHMSYTTAPDFQDRLSQAIFNDLHAPRGKRRTGTAIARQLNRFLRRTLREDQVVDEVYIDHCLRRFANGRAWRDDRVKKLLWEMYVDEKQLIMISPGNVGDDDVSRVLQYFFKPKIPIRGGEPKPLDGLTGKFLMYKKSVGDSNRVLRALVEFKPAGDGALSSEEVHVYRSGRAQKKPYTEIWIGTLLPHERSYFLISKESRSGTPKFATLAVIKKDDGRVRSLRGHSIECIERGDIGPIFQSDIYLERLDDGFDYKTDKSFLDLVDINKLRGSSNRVILTHLGLR